MATAKKSAASSSAPARASKASKRAASISEIQRAHGKEDHEAVTWGALRAVHGEGGSIEEASSGDATGTSGDEHEE